MSSSRTTPPLILVVDDSEADRNMIVAALRARPRPTEALELRDGAEALDYLQGKAKRTNRPPEGVALVLLDLKMPRLSGLDVLRGIRGDATLRHIPVVIFTTSTLDVDILQSYRLGANAYVTKPVSYERFRETVSSIAGFWVELNHRPSLARFVPAPLTA